MSERASVTGDNDQIPVPTQDSPCTACGGAGFINAAPPHQGLLDQVVILEHPQTKQRVQLPWMTQFAYQAGPCNACAGSGEAGIKPLPEKELGSDFVFLQFMADHWQGDAQVKRQIAEMTKKAKVHHDATNLPSKEGLRVILQGVGLNAIQANVVVDAVAGYVGLGV